MNDEIDAVDKLIVLYSKKSQLLRALRDSMGREEPSTADAIRTELTDVVQQAENTKVRQFLLFMLIFVTFEQLDDIQAEVSAMADQPLSRTKAPAPEHSAPPAHRHLSEVATFDTNMALRAELPVRIILNLNSNDCVLSLHMRLYIDQYG